MNTIADHVSSKATQAKNCLALIRTIAGRGADSEDPEQIGYAIQELSQVLLERTGAEDRSFEPVSPDLISDDLEKLYEELAFVDSASESMAASAKLRGQ